MSHGSLFRVDEWRTLYTLQTYTLASSVAAMQMMQKIAFRKWHTVAILFVCSRRAGRGASSGTAATGHGSPGIASFDILHHGEGFREFRNYIGPPCSKCCYENLASILTEAGANKVLLLCFDLDIET